ncbi:MAG: gliding motility-associated C-terminal domain-containing protein, partial [Bacteroidota bacterium]
QPAPAADYIGFNGYTVPISAGTSVIPCETYRLKIAIADYTDPKLDAAVFLRANSFAAGRTATLAGSINGVNTPNNTVVEACNTLDIVFARGDSVLTDPLVVSYDVLPESTATQGVDFTGLPDSIVLPTGVYSDTITLEFTPDNIPEGTENFTIKLRNPCDCSVGELSITILEPPELTGDIIGLDTICQENGVTLEIQPNGGIGNITWEWLNGETDPVYMDTPPRDTTYFAVLTDECNQVDTIFQAVEVIDATATLSGSAIICDGLETPEFQIVLTGGTDYSFDLIASNDATVNYANVTADSVFFLPNESNVYQLENFTANGCPGEANGVAASFAVDITTTAEIDSLNCFGDTDGEITLTPIGGNGQYAYEWSHDNVLADRTATNIAAGDYSIFITDGNGCLDTLSVNVSEPDALVGAIDTLILTANCLENGSLTASATGGTGPYTYAWSDGTSEAAATDLPATLHEVTITDEALCEDILSTAILADSTAPMVTIMPLDELDCGTLSVPITSMGSSSGAEFVYTWTDANDNVLSPPNPAAIEASQEGTYGLLITDTSNGCADSTSTTLTDQSDSPSFSVQQTGEMGCTGSTNTATLFVADSTSNWTIEWRDEADNLVGTNWTFTTASVGNYTAMVTDTTNDCGSSEAYALLASGAAPVLTVDAPQPLTCTDPQVTISANETSNLSNLSLAWSGPTDGIVGVNDELALDVMTSGAYQLIATNDDNNCMDTLVVDIVADQDAPALDALAAAAITCAEVDVTLTATSSSSGDLVYEWQDSDQMTVSNSANVTLTTAGDFNLILTNQDNGCADTLAYTLTADTLAPVASLVGFPDTLDCLLSTSSIDTDTDLNGNYTYAWTGPTGGIDGNDQMQDIVVNLAGTYTLTVTDTDNGCDETLEVTITEDREDPVLNPIADAELNCEQNSIDLTATTLNTGNFNYQWTDDSGLVISTTENALISDVATYTLRVTNVDNSCFSTEEFTVTSNTTPPVVALTGPPDQLDCESGEVTIDTQIDSGSGDYTFAWTGPAGGIGSDNAQADIQALEPGDYTLVVTDNSNVCTDTLSVNVTQDEDVVSLNIIPDTTLTCVRTMIPLTASSPDAGNLSFSWSDSDGTPLSNTADYTIVTDGVYTISVTDLDNDCSNTSTVNVQLDTLSPTITPLTFAPLTCDSLEVTLGAMVGPVDDQPRWTSPEGAALGTTWSQVAMTPGDYVLAVTDGENGCAQTAVFTVTQDTISPVIDILAPLTELDCEQENVALTSFIDGTTSTDFTYEWNGPSDGILTDPTASSVDVQAAGDYTLRITDLDNGCASVSNLAITIDTLAPALTLPTNGTIDCNDPTLALTATSSSTDALTYRWENSLGAVLSTSAAATVSTGGDYTVFLLSEDNGCASEGIVTVTADFAEPTANAGEDQLIDCVNSNATLQAVVEMGNLTPTWFDEAGNQLTSGNWSLSTDSPGQYRLVVLDMDNGCEAEDFVQVERDQSFPVADAGTDTVLDCFAGEAFIDASGSSTGLEFSYTLLDQNNQVVATGNSPDFVVSTAGTYTLEVLNTNNNCSETDEVLVTVSEPVLEDFSLEDLSCTRDEGRIQFDAVSGGTAPYLYSIDGGVTFQMTENFAALPAGAYELVVQDANGCEDAASVSLAAADELIINGLEPEYEVKYGEPLTLFAVPNRTFAEIVDYGWTSSDALSCEQCYETTFDGLESEVVAFSATDSNGCSARVFVRLLVDPRMPVYVPNVFSPNNRDGDNDYFTIYGATNELLEIVSMNIYDRWGAQVFTKQNFAPNDPEQGWNGTLAGQRLNGGVYVYLVEVRLANGQTELLQGDLLLME